MISSMIKRFLTYLLLITFTLNVYAQTTYYFKLTNIHENKSSLKIQGGQFITFVGDICYESDNKGIGVGHGTLTYNPHYSNNNIKKYMGKSYWGNDAVYAFNADKSVLNVITETGMILVYKRDTPPNGVYTCSLIKKKCRQCDPFGALSLPVYVPEPRPALGGTIESSTASTTPEPIYAPNSEGLSATQYLQNYQGYEHVVQGILETFRIVPDMKAGPRIQEMNTLRDCQKSMREIRQEAAKHGISIPQSYYETASP